MERGYVKRKDRKDGDRKRMVNGWQAEERRMGWSAERNPGNGMRR